MLGSGGLSEGWGEGQELGVGDASHKDGVLWLIGTAGDTRESAAWAGDVAQAEWLASLQDARTHAHAPGL